MKAKPAEEKETEVLPAVTPRVNFCFADPRSVRDRDFNGLFLPEMTSCKDFDLLAQRHAVVGRAHFFVFKDGFAEHPHARLRILDAVPKQHASGKREDPVSEAVQTGHGTVFSEGEAVAGDEIQVVIEQPLHQLRHEFSRIGAVGIHGDDDVVLGDVKARTVGSPVPFSWLQMDADVFLKSDFSGPVR